MYRYYHPGEVLGVAGVSILVTLFPGYQLEIYSIEYFFPPIILALAGVTWSYRTRQALPLEREKKKKKSDAATARHTERNDLQRFAQIVAPDMAQTPSEQEQVFNWATRFINRAAKQADHKSARQRTFKQLVKLLDSELEVLASLRRVTKRNPSWSRSALHRLVSALFRIIRRSRKKVKSYRLLLAQRECELQQLRAEIASQQEKAKRVASEAAASLKAYDDKLATLRETQAKEIAVWQTRELAAVNSAKSSTRVVKDLTERLANLETELARLGMSIRRHLFDAPLLNTATPELLLQSVVTLCSQLEKTLGESKAASSATEETLAKATRRQTQLQAELASEHSKNQLREIELSQLRINLAKLEVDLNNSRTTLADRDAQIEQLRLQIELSHKQVEQQELLESSARERVAHWLVNPALSPDLTRETALLIGADLPLEIQVALLHQICSQPEWALEYLAELSAKDHRRMREVMIRLRPEMLQTLLRQSVAAGGEQLLFACAVLEEWDPKKEDLISPFGLFPDLAFGGSLAGVAALATESQKKGRWPEDLVKAARKAVLGLLNSLSENDLNGSTGLRQTIAHNLLQARSMLLCKW